MNVTGGWLDRQADRQTDRQSDRQTDRQSDRQADTDRQVAVTGGNSVIVDSSNVRPM